MKYKNEISVIKVYAVDGNEDDAKFVEVDGAKFEADDADPTKPKLDDKGEKIPFKDQSGGGDGGGNNGGGGDAPKVDSMSLEEIAKLNPSVASLLDDKKKRDEEDEKKAKEQKEKEEKEAAEKGNWQTLAETRGKELEETKGKLDKKDEILGKYVGSVKNILAEVVATIPKENLGLIPENFSPREQLEYITKNAKLLGAKVVGAKGAPVDNNDAEPPATEEGKLIEEFETLQKKENKTQSELTQMMELGKKIKEVRNKK